LKGGIGYVSISGYWGTEKGAEDAFSRKVVSAISATSPQVRCGWIVDLRENQGGNMWPMLAALRPFLGGEKLGNFESPSEKSPAWIAPRNVGSPDVDFTSATVAVLIGPKTASSGEAVAVAFHGRSKTRLFGEYCGTGERKSNF
jgi:carboxyl-terminal processing protease